MLPIKDFKQSKISTNDGQKEMGKKHGREDREAEEQGRKSKWVKMFTKR